MKQPWGKRDDVTYPIRIFVSDLIHLVAEVEEVVGKVFVEDFYVRRFLIRSVLHGARLVLLEKISDGRLIL